ncbi:hypothetical protein Tco_1360832 [Tanacetum coccineum]
MMGELKFYLGLQIHQSPCGIFISPSQYTLELLKKHGTDNANIARKRSKPDKHGHGIEKSAKEPGLKSKGKSKLIAWKEDSSTKLQELSLVQSHKE